MINVASMSITIRCGRAPAFQAFRRARARASRNAAEQRRIGSDRRDHPKGGRVGSDRAEQRLLLAHGAQVGQAVAAVGQHHRQVAHDAARIVPAAPLAHRRQTLRQRRRQAEPVGRLGQQPAPACDTSPSPSDATSTVKRRPSRCTLKVILPSRGFDLRHAEESLLSRTVQRPRPPGPQLLHARSGLGNRTTSAPRVEHVGGPGFFVNLHRIARRRGGAEVSQPGPPARLMGGDASCSTKLGPNPAPRSRRCLDRTSN